MVDQHSRTYLGPHVQNIVFKIQFIRINIYFTDFIGCSIMIYRLELTKMKIV